MEARHGVYVLTNSETKGIVKVGMTTRHVNDRIPELHQTGTIGRYSCVGFIRTDGNPEMLERQLHRSLSKHHVNNEYFRVSPETVMNTAVGLMGQHDTVVISPIDIAEAQRKARVQQELEVARRRAEVKRKEEERLKREREDAKLSKELAEKRKRQEAETKEKIGNAFGYAGIVAAFIVGIFIFGWFAENVSAMLAVNGFFVLSTVCSAYWGATGEDLTNKIIGWSVFVGNVGLLVVMNGLI